MRRFLLLAIFLACSRETPVPNQPPTQPSQPTLATQPPPSAPAVAMGTYDEGLTWFKSTPGFDFTIEDDGIQAQGTLRRKTIGAEVVTFRGGQGEWRASAGSNGVSWERRDAAAWTRTEAPSWGNRLYQRITLAIDPQKREGAASLAGTEGGTNQYRFTNANSGEVHEVWVDQRKGHVVRMRIGETMNLVVTNPL